MDSGNSASMQSSSGGDEADFDSRGGGETSFSSFLNINNLNNFNPQQFLTQQSQDQTPTTFFDPQNHFSNENNNLIWSTNSTTTSTRGLRSTHEPNYPIFTHQSMPTTTTTTTTTQLGGGPNSLSPYHGPSSSSSLQLQPTHATSSDLHQYNNKLSNVIKNPKKRTRASRRAPTTVLTTDTTNFRQMVQEFTGIPAAPFTGNPASSYSRRLDLYSAASALRSGAYLDSLGPLYPLRPTKGLMEHNVYGGGGGGGAGAATSSSNNNNNNNNANNNNYNQQLPLMNLQQQLHSSGGGTMNFGNLMSGGATFHQSTTQEIVRNNNNNNINDGGQENFVDGNLNISNKNPTQGNVASWNYPSD